MTDRSAAKPTMRPTAATGAGDARPCPICGTPSVAERRPFCSKRCADVDLNRWLKGAYAIPAVEPDDEWDTAGAPPASDRDA